MCGPQLSRKSNFAFWLRAGHTRPYGVLYFFLIKRETKAAAIHGPNASTSHQPAVGINRVYHARAGFSSMPVNSVGTPPTLSGSMRSPVTHLPPRSNVYTPGAVAVA